MSFDRWSRNIGLRAAQNDAIQFQLQILFACFPRDDPRGDPRLEALTFGAIVAVLKRRLGSNFDSDFLIESSTEWVLTNRFSTLALEDVIEWSCSMNVDDENTEGFKLMTDSPLLYLNACT